MSRLVLINFETGLALHALLAPLFTGPPLQPIGTPAHKSDWDKLSTWWVSVNDTHRDIEHIVVDKLLTCIQLATMAST